MQRPRGTLWRSGAGCPSGTGVARSAPNSRLGPPWCSPTRWHCLPFPTGAPARAISTLELLATTAGLVIFAPATLGRGAAGVASVAGLADSQVSAAVASRGLAAASPLLRGHGAGGPVGSAVIRAMSRVDPPAVRTPRQTASRSCKSRGPLRAGCSYLCSACPRASGHSSSKT